MPLPNPNILRYDGPIDRYVMRPLGVMRCPPVVAAASGPSQFDADTYLRVHEPTFDQYITWQKSGIALLEERVQTARGAQDMAQFKQWVAIGTLLPTSGLLATSYVMMFTFPFTVPGAILFAITSVGIALLVGYEERARGQYNEAHSEWQRVSWKLETKQADLLAAEETYGRARVMGREQAQHAQRAGSTRKPSRPASRRRGRCTTTHTPSPVRMAAACGVASLAPSSSPRSSTSSRSCSRASSSRSGSVAPGARSSEHQNWLARFASSVVPPPEMFGYAQSLAEDFSSDEAASDLQSTATASSVV